MYLLPVFIPITSLYLLLIGSMIYYLKKLPAWKAPHDYRPRELCSIIIPARNEATNIKACLDSLLRQNYPRELMEIIVVDDHSEDDTASIVRPFSRDGVRLIQMKNSAHATNKAFKKHALAIGIQQSSGKYIITTDADCVSPPSRLRNLLWQMESRQLQALTAPVLIRPARNLFEHFQALEFLSLMGITALGHATQLMPLANGANFCFTRRAFKAVNGYDGIDDIASGDDVLLMQKIISRFPGQVAFAKNPEAAVFTRAEPSLRAFVQQRLRWAAKNFSHGSKLINFTWELVWLNNAVLWMCMIQTLYTSRFFLPAFLCLSANIVMDYLFLRRAARLFHAEKSLQYFLPAFFIHRCYLFFVPLASLLRLPVYWKKRKIKK